MYSTDTERGFWDLELTSNNHSPQLSRSEIPEDRWTRIRKVERRGKCDCPVCHMLPAGAFRGATVPRPPRVTALVNHHLCKVGIFKWPRKGITGIFLPKIPTTFHNRWDFWANSLLGTKKYWVLREGTTEVLCTPVYTDSDSWYADSLGNVKLWIVG